MLKQGILFILLFGLFSLKANKNIEQVFINFGMENNQINYSVGDFGELQVGGMDIGLDNHIYIVDLGDNSLKEFDEMGKYIRKFDIDEYKPLNVTYFEKKLYIFNKTTNDLYNYSANSFELIRVWKNIFKGYLFTGTEEKINDCLLFRATSAYNRKQNIYIFNMENEQLYSDSKFPFNKINYMELNDEEIDFLNQVIANNLTLNFIGSVKNQFFVFQQSIYALDQRGHKIYFVNINKRQEKYEIFINETEIGKNLFILDNHWRLKKNQFLYFLGGKDNKIVISKIHLDEFFPKIYKIDEYSSEANIQADSFSNKLAQLTVKELQLKRNEIFARYGRTFKTSWIQEYFNKQSWYSPNPDYSDSLLTDEDVELIKLIKEVEIKKKGNLEE